MSSKFNFYWQALPAVAVMAAFMVSLADGSSAAETAPAVAVTAPSQPVAAPVEAVAVTTPAAATVDVTPVATSPAVEPSPMADSTDDDRRSNALSLSEADVTCLAKIIHHESANQPDAGQFAVAHVVLNRLASPRFPKSVCSIALQQGQFFNVHAYDPSRHPLWPHSQQIARRAIAGEGHRAAPGALFFHTAGYSSRFFRSRPRVTQIAGHVFYR